MRRLINITLLALLILTTLSIVVANASPAPPRVNEKAPDFELTDLRGNAHKLGDYRGKVIVLNFWATWCSECVLEMPSLNALYEKLKADGFVALGISIDRNWGDIEKMKIQPTYPVFLDAKGDVFVRTYTVTRLPATFIIDQNGVIVEKFFGRQEFDSEVFIDKIKLLLRGAKPK